MPPRRVPKEGGRAGSVEKGELEEHGALEADPGVGLESVLVAGRHIGDFDGAGTAQEGTELILSYYMRGLTVFQKVSEYISSTRFGRFIPRGYPARFRPVWADGRKAVIEIELKPVCFF